MIDRTAMATRGWYCPYCGCAVNHKPDKCPRCDAGLIYPTESRNIDRERRASRVIGRERDPRVRECCPKVPEYERGDLP